MVSIRYYTVAFLLTFAFIFSAQSASAAITVDSVTGKWQNALGQNPGDPITHFSQPSSNVIRWGDPATSGGNSGYQFIGAAPPSQAVAIDTPFSLGTFTHFNFPIFTANPLGSVDLATMIKLSIDSTPVNFTTNYGFLHDETPNSCVGKGCSDDLVMFTNNTASQQVFQINGQDYTVALLGFKTDLAGPLLTTFNTVEGQQNDAFLFAQVTRAKVLVPEPSTYLLMAGFLGLAFVRRHRMQAKKVGVK